MKDLIAKLKSDANVALGSIWMHIDAQAARIAELEAQIAASAPADTDKLREAILTLDFDADYADVSLQSAFDRGVELALSAAADVATALQAPVREVPGYKLVPLEVTDAMLEAWKNEICIPVGSSPEAKARRAYKAMLAAAPLPAAPVQESSNG